MQVINGTVRLQSNSNSLVKELYLLPNSVNIAQSEYSNPLDNLKIIDNELYFRIPQLTVNGVDYLDIEGCIYFYPPSIKDKPRVMFVSLYQGVKKQYKDELKRVSAHGLTVNAKIKIRQDIESSYQSVFSENLEQINNLLLDLAAAHAIALVDAEINRLNELKQAAIDIRSKLAIKEAVML